MKRCPGCAGCRHYRLGDGRLKCRACGLRFTWTSVWDSVRLPTATKARLLELFVLGVPSYRQRFLSDTSAVSRERFYRLVRGCCALVEQLREPFEGAIECDETTFGGARKGKRGWGAAGKVIVFGLVKRNGCVKAMPIPAHDRASIMREIEAHTREGALYYTDEWQAYATLKLRGEHVMIRKEKGLNFTHECVDITVDHGISGAYVVRVLDQAARFRGYPRAVRTDNGPEFTSRAFIAWTRQHGIAHLLIEPGRPMQNGYIESFNGKFRDECLNEHWFTSLAQAREVISEWRRELQRGQTAQQLRPHPARPVRCQPSHPNPSTQSTL